MILKNKIKKNIVFKALPFHLYTILSYGLNFYWISIVLDVLGDYNYGLFVLITSLALFLLNVLEFKTSEATTYFIKKISLSKVISTSMLFDTIIFFLFLIITFLIVTPVNQYYFVNSNINLETLIYGFLANLPLVLVSTFLGYLSYFEKFWIFNSLNLLPLIIKIFLFHFLSINNLLELFQITFISNFIISIIAIISLIKILKFTFIIDKNFCTEYFKFSSRNFVSTLLKSGHQNIEKLFIGFYLDVKLVGVYEIFIKIASFSTILVNPISAILYPKYVKSLKSVKDIDFKRIINISLAIFIISLISILFAFFLKDIIFDILNFNYSNYQNFKSIKLFFILILLHRCFLSTAWWVRIIPLSLGKADIPIYTNLFQFIFIPIACYLFISQYGIMSIPIIKILEVILGITLVWFLLNRLKS